MTENRRISSENKALRDIANAKGDLSHIQKAVEQLAIVIMTGSHNNSYEDPMTGISSKAIEGLRNLFGESLYFKIRELMKNKKKQRKTQAKKSLARRKTVKQSMYQNMLLEVQKDLEQIDEEPSFSGLEQTEPRASLKVVKDKIGNFLKSKKADQISQIYSEIGSDIDSQEQFLALAPIERYTNQSIDTIELPNFEDQAPYRFQEIKLKLIEAEKKEKRMKDFITRLIAAYDKHKHLKEAIHEELGLDEGSLPYNDILQTMRA